MLEKSKKRDSTKIQKLFITRVVSTVKVHNAQDPLLVKMRCTKQKALNEVTCVCLEGKDPPEDCQVSKLAIPMSRGAMSGG